MRVFVAMGSNIDPRLGYLKQAKCAFAEIAVDGSTLVSAPLYRTSPVNCPPESGEFINTVVGFEWDGCDPLVLLDQLQSIERSLGRDRSADIAPNAPRTIDLDILFTDAGEFEHPRLTLPHPRLHLRRFVLEPLAEIAGDVRIHNENTTVNDLLASLDSGEPALSMVTRHW